MENNNGWYDRYREYQRISQTSVAEPQGKTVKKKKKAGISTTGLVCLVLAAALLSAAVGSVTTGLIMRKSYASVQVPETSSQTQAVVSGNPGSIKTSEENNSARPDESPKAPVITSAGASGGTVLSKEQIIEIAAPSVVGIDVVVQKQYSSPGYGWPFGGFGGSQDQVYETEGAGSGVIITSDGYIVTCDHVVEGASSIIVTLNDDTEYEASVVGTDKKYDIAIIKINPETALASATLGDSDMLTVGQDVVAIGNHLGELRGTATSGIVSAMNRDVNVEGSDMTLIQHDAAISPGSSGGGLFNESGTLIGIVNAKASTSESEGLGFAIPVNSVKQVIDDLMQFGYVKGRAYLGVATQNRSLQMDGGRFGFFGMNDYGTNCVEVYQVTAGSAAEKAGIKANDLIVKVGDVEITSNEVLSSTIGRYNAGDTTTVTIMRDGTEMELEVTFGEYSPQQ